jgi:hypothetical protein
VYNEHVCWLHKIMGPKNVKPVEPEEEGTMNEAMGGRGER